MDAILALSEGFTALLAPQYILACLLGAFLGTLGGVLPGLGPTGTMAILLPFVLTLDTLSALIILAGIAYGANFGNSTAAILLNIPGDPSAVPTALDGHPLALQGRGGPALAVAALASFATTLLGTLTLAFIAPVVASFALRVGAPEYFGLLLLALTIVSSFSQGSAVKGFLMMAFGVALTLPGLDPVTGSERLTFGVGPLIAGFSLIPVAMGLFAFGEVFHNALRRSRPDTIPQVGKLLPSLKELKPLPPVVARSGLLGFIVGVLPGTGPAPAAFAAYGMESRVNKDRDQFGSGSFSGLAAPESASNAAAAGAFVPTLTLGIPGSAPLAVLLGALMVLGARPGPLFLDEQPDLYWAFMASLIVASILLLILNLPMIRLWVKLLSVPYPLLAAVILVLTVAGVYSFELRMSDVWIALILGIVSVALRRGGFPLAPIILGFVLGEELERNLRLTLEVSGGSLMIFVERVPSLIILLGVVLVVTYPAMKFVYRRVRGAPRVPEANA